MERTIRKNTKKKMEMINTGKEDNMEVRREDIIF